MEILFCLKDNLFKQHNSKIFYFQIKNNSIIRQSVPSYKNLGLVLLLYPL